MEKNNPIGATLQSLIYDCGDPEALSSFYAKLLGGTVSADPYGGHSVTLPGLGLDLGFQRDEFYRRPVFLGREGDQQPMLHIDIKVRDRAEATAYALSIGATMPNEQFCQPDWPIQWVTLLDPEGHPFCLFDE